LGSFVFLIFAKLFNSNVGMYYKEGKFQALGLMKGDADYQEVLGYWFIPVMLITIIILYFIITLILKAKRILNNKK
jgi:phosphotransferase system  glucose/maltose/N-acetylglucosamine-specific IIC component